MSHDIGFAPTVRCPHCNHVLRPQFTGWGRTGLNTRYKACYQCGLDFTITAYVFTSKEDISDGDMAAVQASIKHLREYRKERFKELQQVLFFEQLKTKGYTN